MTTLAIVLLVLAASAALVAMRVGWRHRADRTATAVPLPPPVPDAAELGLPRREPVPGTYVSTTFTSSWLDRVAAHGLGVRSTASVELYDAGLVLRRDGAPDVFVPARALQEATTADGIAGKVVGGGRLVAVTWRLGDVLLTTGVLPRRAGDRDGLVAAITDLTETSAAEEQR